MRILMNGFESTSSDVSTQSSDSEYFLEKDIKDSGNQISQQWEAIERTLYQETGDQVSDPELLKECKLWRDTFPHFRVKGTRIDVKKSDEGGRDEGGCWEERGDADTEKGIQTLSNHFNLMKINEKRESIKKKVVGELVERLIAKFNNNKGGGEVKSNLDNDSPGEPTFQVTEKRDTLLSGDTSPSVAKTVGKVPEFSKRSDKLSGRKEDAFDSETESYFERGKLLRNLENMKKADSSLGVTREQMEKSFYQIFDDWEKEIDDEVNRKKAQTKNSARAQEIIREDSDYPKTEYPKPNLSRPEKPNPRILKPKKMGPPPDSLSRLTKPFEITKKIDKKYEGLLEKILDRKPNETISSFRTNSSKRRGVKGFHETFEEVTLESVFDEPHLKINKNFPKINKFNNHWLERGEINSNYNLGDSDFSQRSANSTRASANPNKSVVPSNSHMDRLTHFGMDEKFLEELKREMFLGYKRPAKRTGVIENISLRRPKPRFNLPEETGKSQKSSSCGDLPRKSKKVRPAKPGPDNPKNSKSTNLNNSKVKKSNSNQNGLLPPIESGIICTELTGRPKIGFKNPPKR